MKTRTALNSPFVFIKEIKYSLRFFIIHWHLSLLEISFSTTFPSTHRQSLKLCESCQQLRADLRREMKIHNNGQMHCCDCLLKSFYENLVSSKVSRKWFSVGHIMRKHKAAASKDINVSTHLACLDKLCRWGW